ncbi:MAG: hypothetical protein OHK0052_07890 [Anaerolineales bacterium]
MNLRYRLMQFWHALRQTPSAQDLEEVRALLAPPQAELFLKMQPAEQTHALRVLRFLQQQGQQHPNLLCAALLHDVGKILYPLALWQRVWIVLAQTFLPSRAHQWAQNPRNAWQKALQVAEKHPEWGAHLAAESGCESLTIQLILRHQEYPYQSPNTLEDWLLTSLQVADNMC